mgnify:CR=1 FL=1
MTGPCPYFKSKFLYKFDPPPGINNPWDLSSKYYIDPSLVLKGKGTHLAPTPSNQLTYETGV